MISFPKSNRHPFSNAKQALFAYTVFDTVIPRNTRLAEAPSFGMPVLEYDSKAPGSEAYRALAKEVIRNNR